MHKITFYISVLHYSLLVVFYVFIPVEYRQLSISMLSKVLMMTTLSSFTNIKKCTLGVHSVPVKMLTGKPALEKNGLTRAPQCVLCRSSRV